MPLLLLLSQALPCFTVASFTKHPLKVTCCEVFLAESQEPTLPVGPRQVQSGPGPFLVTALQVAGGERPGEEAA